MNGSESKFLSRSWNIASALRRDYSQFPLNNHLNTKFLFLNTKFASPARCVKSVLKRLTPSCTAYNPNSSSDHGTLQRVASILQLVFIEKLLLLLLVATTSVNTLVTTPPPPPPPPPASPLPHINITTTSITTATFFHRTSLSRPSGGRAGEGAHPLPVHLED